MGDTLKKIQAMPIEEKLRRLTDADRAYILGYIDRAILECSAKPNRRAERKNSLPEEKTVEKKRETGGKYG